MESKKCLTVSQKYRVESWMREKAGLPEEMITLAHATETLARTIYTFHNQGDQATPWDLVTGDVREYYIDRALEELRK